MHQDGLVKHAVCLPTDGICRRTGEPSPSTRLLTGTCDKQHESDYLAVPATTAVAAHATVACRRLLLLLLLLSCERRVVVTTGGWRHCLPVQPHKLGAAGLHPGATAAAAAATAAAVSAAAIVSSENVRN